MNDQEEFDELKLDDMGSLLDYMSALRKARNRRKTANRHKKRTRLSVNDRRDILNKTAERCHICGGIINDRWQADHVLAHSGGGDHSPDNYLPAHKLCNNYRWDYLPAEFQILLKLGVWCRTHIEKQTSIGQTLGEQFRKYEKSRMTRKKIGSKSAGRQAG